MNELSSGRQTCSIREAAQMLGISTDCAYRAAREGSLPTIRMGGRILVPLAALKALLEASK